MIRAALAVLTVAAALLLGGVVVVAVAITWGFWPAVVVGGLLVALDVHLAPLLVAGRLVRPPSVPWRR